jgi:hypothetical protein
MIEGGYKNHEKITIRNRGYGVVVIPEPVYQYPEGHPCHGCAFVFQVNKPSCPSGSYPDTENCPTAFYRKIQNRHKAAYDERLRQIELKK